MGTLQTYYQSKIILDGPKKVPVYISLSLERLGQQKTPLGVGPPENLWRRAKGTLTRRGVCLWSFIDALSTFPPFSSIHCPYMLSFLSTIHDPWSLSMYNPCFVHDPWAMHDALLTTPLFPISFSTLMLSMTVHKCITQHMQPCWSKCHSGMLDWRLPAPQPCSHACQHCLCWKIIPAKWALARAECWSVCPQCSILPCKNISQRSTPIGAAEHRLARLLPPLHFHETLWTHAFQCLSIASFLLELFV